MSKPSKSTRKDDKLQQLERELAAQKKKNAELQKQKTIRLDDEQLESIFNRLEQDIEWSTNRVVDEMPRYVTTPRFGERKNNSGFFSLILRIIIALIFFVLSFSIIWVILTYRKQYWSEGLAQRFALIVVAMVGICCFILGVEMLKEKDRNYVVAVFSALVAVVALIVAFVK